MPAPSIRKQLFAIDRAKIEISPPKRDCIGGDGCWRLDLGAGRHDFGLAVSIFAADVSGYKIFWPVDENHFAQAELTEWPGRTQTIRGVC
jgi:hypothetical protein